MSILQTRSGAVGGFVLIICIIAGFGMVSAAELSVSSPDVAKPGEPVSMYIANVDNGNSLNITITGQVKTNAGSPVSVQVRDLTLPVDLIGATLSFIVNNVEDEYGFFSYEIDGSGVTHLPVSVNNGVCSESYGPINLDAHTENLFMFNGTASKDRSIVNVIINGTPNRAISSPELFSFNAGGFTNGIFNAEVKVMNGATEVAKKNLAFTIQDSLVSYT